MKKVRYSQEKNTADIKKAEKGIYPANSVTQGGPDMTHLQTFSQVFKTTESPLLFSPPTPL